MEEKIKNSIFSPPKHISDDKNRNQNNTESIKINSTIIMNSSNKVDYIYKMKELNKFKEEILSFMHERDNYYLDKIKKFQSQIEKNNKNFEKLSEIVETNKNNCLSNQIEFKDKIDKLKVYDAFVNKANDKLISHEIRLNSLREDLTKSNQKYDKLYLENLELPGYIGRSSKYPNCRFFFTEIIKEMDKCNNYREKNTIDFNTYKDRLENIIKTFQSIVENNNDSQIKYITQLNNKTNKVINETMEEKMKFLRLDNSHFASDLIKKTNELNELYDKINVIKENILQEFNNMSDKYNQKFEDNKKILDEYKGESKIIKKKFEELSDYVKNGKTKKIFGKKELNLNNRKINKDLITEAKEKETKLIPNTEDIDKKDFNSNTVDYKPNINDRFSKSQNNFNNNNNLGKKNFFGLGYGGKNNIHKKKFSTENLKNEFKFKQGTVSYCASKNIIESNSVKNLAKKRNFTKSTYLKLNFDNLKNEKNNLKPIDIPNSERQHEIKKDSIIKKINKEKVDNDYAEDLKVMKLRKDDKKIKNNINNDELSITESCISNLNNSINTFSTNNDKNNSFNSICLNINNNNKTSKFNLFGSDLEHNNKIIKEIASDLEQSTAKGNNLASQKKDIEDNFKVICHGIQPINLKLSNKKQMEKIEEYTEKNNIINKSEQNTTIFSNNNINNVETSIISNSNNIVGRNNKLKELIELTEKLEDNNNSKVNNSKNNNNESCINDLDQKMNIYNKKLGDLETFTKDHLLDIIKQMNLLKKHYLIITKALQKENKNINMLKLNEFHTINSILNKASQSKPNIFSNNKNLINNENNNILNMTTNLFYKKTPKTEMNQKLSAIVKKEQTSEDINLSDNLFYNGNYYFNIKDILEQKKEKKSNSNYENKKLLKVIDSNIADKKKKNNYKNKILKCNSLFDPDNNGIK